MSGFEYIPGGNQYEDYPYSIIHGIGNEGAAYNVIALLEENGLQDLSGGDSAIMRYTSGNDDVIIFWGEDEDDTRWAFFDAVFEDGEPLRDHSDEALDLKVSDMLASDLFEGDFPDLLSAFGR